MIALKCMGDTPETRFIVPIMEATPAFVIMRKKLGIKTDRELRFNLSIAHCGNSHAPLPQAFLEGYPFLDITPYAD